MAETTGAAPSVVVHNPVVAEPEVHASQAEEAAAAEADAAAQAPEKKDADDGDKIVSLDRSDQPAAAPEGEAEAEPAAGEGDAEPAAEGEAEAEADAEGEGEGAADMIEFNFGGNSLEVPKDSMPPELAEKVQAFSSGIWADYTRKSQEITEKTSALDARGTALEKMAGLNGAALQTYSTGLLLREEIAQLQAVNLESLWQSSNPADQDQARQISDALGKKQAQFQNIVARVGEQEAELDGAHQEELTRQTEAGKVALDKDIKDFSTKHAPDVVAYAVAQGMPQANADTWAVNPMLTKMAFKAMLYDRMQARAAKAATAPQSEAKPVPAMKAKGGANAMPSDPNDMTMGQLKKHLNLPG
tara:strand:- start:11510 stop:12586 length:1077 start_codon:yes stop_codon:yes gene_type:complete